MTCASGYGVDAYSPIQQQATEGLSGQVGGERLVDVCEALDGLQKQIVLLAADDPYAVVMPLQYLNAHGKYYGGVFAVGLVPCLRYVVGAVLRNPYIVLGEVEEVYVG